MGPRVIITIIFGILLWVSGVKSNLTLLFLNCWNNCEDDIQYFLYSRNNPESYQELKINDTSLLMASNFNFSRKTKIIVHGWLQTGTSQSSEEIKNAYLKVTDDNIITVDWSTRATTFYTLARKQVTSVSQSLTDFLKFLVEHGVRTGDIHLIGHSLGAHVVGIAAKYYRKQMKPIWVITGLDPAKPFFGWSDTDNRLDKSDAIHVEVIHTCGGFLGIPDPVGHLDFYPNGGRKQPGCGWDVTGACAHNRAVLFFAESITSRVPFTSVKCESYDEVYTNGECSRTNAMTLNMNGLYLNVENQGVYYLKTHAEAPFALGNPDNWGESSRGSSKFSIVSKIKTFVNKVAKRLLHFLE